MRLHAEGAKPFPGPGGRAVHLHPKKGEDEEEGKGTTWVLTAQEAASRLFISYVIGGRDEDTAKALFTELERRRARDTGLPLFTSDKWDPFAGALLRVYGVYWRPPYKGRGRPPKPRLVPPGDLLYAQVVKHRRNGRVVWVERRVVYGSEEEVARRLRMINAGRKVNTSYVERNNLGLRTCVSRLVRRSLNYSKDERLLDAHLSLFQGYYNFVKPHKSLRVRSNRPSRKWTQRTPAMAHGITDHIWTWEELLSSGVPPR